MFGLFEKSWYFLRVASATHINHLYDDLHMHKRRHCQYHDDEDHTSSSDCCAHDPADGCEYEDDDEDETTTEPVNDTELH